MTSVAGMLVAVGMVAVVLVAADLGLTVLHPSIRGPLSDRAEHLAWVIVRGLTRLGGRDRLLSFGGPAAMAADLLTWVAGLWLGFALIYAPYVHGFGYAHAGQAAHAGFTEALYLSGESLTTAGFGDVTAGSQALRLVTIGEAASGLALIAAAIAYLTAVHPRVSLVRAAACWASDLQAGTELGAVRFACGRDEVARLHRDLIEIHQDLLRFPVLYYFHPRGAGESIASLLRAAGLVCASLSWGLDREAVPFADLYGPGLQRTIERLMDSYAREFSAVKLAGAGKPLGQQEAQARLLHLREAVRRVAPCAVSGKPGAPPDLARFLARTDAFLREFGRVHHHGSSAAPLFAEPPGLSSASRGQRPGLTGPASQLAAVWKDYGIEVELPAGASQTVHSDYLFFINPLGHERFLAEPFADQRSDGTGYLPAGTVSRWGQGIARYLEQAAAG